MACAFSGNERRTGAEIRPAIVSGMVTGDAPVRYWPILSLSLVTVAKVFVKVNLISFLRACKVANCSSLVSNQEETFSLMSVNCHRMDNVLDLPVQSTD